MTPPELEPLLSHESFLRKLAGQLVNDPAAQDDVVQETWLAALRRPGEARRAERGWLATVARNAARMTWRSDQRRRRREQAVARPERAPSVESVREREAARRSVVEAVLRLGEPYRSVVLLRFYEGLAPRDVARRLGVPVETARTQTRRAVERLREDLDRREGRASWRATLAPLALPPAGLAEAGGLLGGWIVMALKTRTALLLVLLVLTAGTAAYFALSRDGTAREGPDLGAGARGADALGAEAPERPPEEEGRSPRLAGAPAAPEPAARPTPTGPDIFRHSRARGVLRGLVFSGRTHDPVAGAEVLAVMERGSVPDGMELRERPEESGSATTDAEGRFVVKDLPVGAYRVEVRHAEEGAAESVGLAADAPPWIRLYLMPERPEHRTRVVRVTDAQGRPVAGAEVECVLEGGAWRRGSTADEEGLVRFEDLPRSEHLVLGWVTASAPEGRGRTELRYDTRYRGPDIEPLAIVLRPAGAIAGRLVAPGGASLAGARVAAWSMTGGQGTWANGIETVVDAGADGSFRVEDLPAGEYMLLVTTATGLRMDLPRKDTGVTTDWAPRRVEVEPGRTTEVEIPLVAGGTIRGRVLTTAAAPVRGARVEVHLPQGAGDHAERVTRAGVPLWRLDGASPDARRFPLTFRVLTTDAEGRYEATGLLPGSYRVQTVPGEDLSFDRREPVVVRDGGFVEVEHRVERAGTLELTARPFDSVGLRREGQAEFHTALITPPGALGALTVPGLPTGRWEAFNLHSDERVPPVRLAAFEVRAGEITYLDVSDAGDVRVRLRVLATGRPMAGVQVGTAQHGWATPVTDDEGRASWASTTYGPVASVEVVLRAEGRRSIPLTLQVPVREEETDVHLPSGALEIRVRDAQGRTVEGARVGLTLPTPQPGAGYTIGRGEHVLATDAEGIARWRFVPPGAYRVEVRLPDHRGRATATATVGDGPTSVDVHVAEAGRVRLRVVGSDGRPAADVAVGLSVLPKSEESADWARALTLTENGWRTDAEGVFLVRGVPEGTARAYAWVMDAHGWSAAENAQGDVRVVPGQTVDLDLKLRPVGK